MWLSKTLLAHGIRFVVLMITVGMFPEKPKTHEKFALIANEPAEAGEAAENSAARRMAYAKKFSIGIEKCKCKV